jgi:hypothetical protein
MGAAAEGGIIDAVIPYVVAGESSIFYPGDRERSYWPVEEHTVAIHDARADQDRLALEETGFVLLRRPTAVTNVTDPETVRAAYYPEIEALVKELTGASRVLIFGEIVRTDAAGTPDHRLPARGAHVDYDEPTVQWWTRQLVGEAEAERLLKGRHVLINLWRPITTVEKSPLAVCDASTVLREDLNPSEVRGGLNDHNRAPMRGLNLAYSPRHRWYYVPRMQPDEILAFKLCDSDQERVQWTGHTAFEDPTSAPDAAPRQSIEIRTISFFD